MFRAIHQIIGLLCSCHIWHIILCLIASANTLRLYTFPWASIVTGVILIVLAKYHLYSFNITKKICWYISALCLIATLIIANYVLSSVLLSLWLLYLGKSSAQENRWVVNIFSNGILLFLTADLFVVSHGITSLLLNDASHLYSNLIRESLGGIAGETTGAYRLHVPFIIYTLILILAIPTKASLRAILFIFQLCVSTIGIFLGYYLTPLLFWSIVSLTTCIAVSFLGQKSIAFSLHKSTVGTSVRAGKKVIRISSIVFLSLLSVYGIVQITAKVFHTTDSKPRILFINDKYPNDVEGGENDMTFFIRADGNKNYDNFLKEGKKPRYDKLAFQFLPSLGYDVDVKEMESVNPEDFSRYKLIVLMCIQNTMPKEHKDALYATVKEGDSNVLILGDHTDIQRVQAPFNDLMSPMGIELNYDSAIPFGQWDSQIKYCRHPINGGRAFTSIGAGNDPGISVGATLKLKKGVACSVIEAVDGFVDQGTPNAPQFAGLGDMMYNPNEVRGGFVLAAERRFGRGTFLAFGDTALFQNISLARNFDYVASVFSYLTHTPYLLNSPLYFWLVLAGGLIIIIDLAFNYSVFLSVVSIFVMIFSSLVCSDLRSQPDVIRGMKHGVIIIDDKHSRAFRYHDSKKGITGILEILYEKKDEITLISDSLGLLTSENVKGIVLLAPRGTFINGYKKQINRFINNGGWMLFASGYYEMRGHEDLLDTIGIRILPVPLGSTQNITVTDQQLTHAPLFVETWEISASTQGWSAEAFGFGRPVAVTNCIGNGRVIVIADSFFLLDEHIGQGSSVSVTEINFAFLSSLLNRTDATQNIEEEK